MISSLTGSPINNNTEVIFSEGAKSESDAESLRSQSRFLIRWQIRMNDSVAVTASMIKNITLFASKLTWKHKIQFYLLYICYKITLFWIRWILHNLSYACPDDLQRYGYYFS